LLPTTLMAGVADAGQSAHAPPGYSSPPLPYATPPASQYPPPPGTVYHGQITSNDGYREAPTHRPYARRESSAYTHNSGRDSPGPNTAGRGAYRR
jgi:hypothetical protein